MTNIKTAYDLYHQSGLAPDLFLIYYGVFQIVWLCVAGRFVHSNDERRPEKNPIG